MANKVLYGFYDLRHLFGQRVTTALVPTINSAVDASIREHNRAFNALFGLLVQRVPKASMRYKSTAAETLQPLDENGRALPTQGLNQYDVAFPLQAAGTAWGANRITRLKMTVEEANDISRQKLEADIRWMRNHIYAGILSSASYVWDDKEFGNITVQPLASGDENTYNTQLGADVGQADNHLYAQAAAISDAANPFPTIHDELMEHPENGGEVIAFIPQELRASVEGLASFRELGDPDITRGSGSDVLTGRLDTPVPGVVIGKADRCWVVELKTLPATHGFAITTEGDRALGMREHPEEELQGFQRVAERVDHPYHESQYERHAGFGGLNRVGAVAFRIGNGTYAAPTGFAAPIP